MEPRRYLGLVRYQRLFPKRQAEIARDYGRVAAEEILTPSNLLRVLTDGETGMAIARIVLESAERRIDAVRPAVEMMVQTRIDDKTVALIRGLLVQRVALALPEVQTEVEQYLQEKLDIERTVEGKLASMSKPEFERVLRGIFEEDEAILIVIGGVLGGLVGLLQAFVVVSLSL